MKKVAFTVLISILLLTSCGNRNTTNGTSETLIETSVTESGESAPETSSAEESDVSVESSETTSTETVNESESTTENTGNEDWCLMHNLVYHSFSPSFVNYVGQDNFETWIRNGDANDICGVNIIEFVKYFDISYETFMELYADETAGLTDEYFESLAGTGITRDNYYGSYTFSQEQIDAIYSGDEAQIENAFAGNLSVTADDGNRYSLLWLEKHSPEDYLEAGISPESIDALVDEVNTNSDYTKYRTEMQALSEQASQAAVMMESAAE